MGFPNTLAPVSRRDVGIFLLTLRHPSSHDGDMRRIVGITMMFLAMFSIAGGHWAVLQTVAWAQMLRDYSQESGFATAVTQTFSGERPCTMCKSIEKNRQQEEKAPPLLKVDKKAEVFVAAWREIFKVPQSSRFSYAPEADALLAWRNDPPPTPVPIVHSLTV